MPIDRDAADALQADMADHQRQFRGEVTGEANRVLLAGELERVEKMQDEAARAPAPARPAPPAPPPRTVEAKHVNEHTYALSRQAERADESLVRAALPHEAEWLTLVGPRIEQLLAAGDPGPLGTPSWRDRLLAVMETKNKAMAWKAAAQEPNQLALTRKRCADDQALMRVLGVANMSDLTPAYCARRAQELTRQFVGELAELLEASNRVFGAWHKPHTPTLYAGI